MMLFLLLLLAAAAPLLQPPGARATLPPQGVYEECAPARQHHCGDELAMVGRAGFRLSLNYTAWYGSARAIRRYAKAAAAAGVKLIWPLNALPWRGQGRLARTYPALARSCRCRTNQRFRRYAIELVRSLPATWGYYIGDEVSPSKASVVATLAARVRQLDPHHPLLYIGQSWPSVTSNLAPFVPLTDVLGADVYPIGTASPTDTVAKAAAAIADVTTAAQKQSAIVLQAFSWSQYPGDMPHLRNPHFPTESEMLQMRNYALAYNPSMILWYNVHDVLRARHPAAHWRDLVRAAFAPPPLPAPAPSGPGSTSTATSTPGGGGG